MIPALLFHSAYLSISFLRNLFELQCYLLVAYEVCCFLEPSLITTINVLFMHYGAITFKIIGDRCFP